MTEVRAASHAGSWYSDDGTVLDNQLEGWLSRVDEAHKPARAIISPHAGYTYCGATGAYGFKQIDPDTVKCIFILGPSHHVYLPGCAISTQDICETPLGPLVVDKDIVSKLKATGEFEDMPRSVDEDEHSIEMQLPYIKKVMGDRKFTVIPILVGALDDAAEASYGKMLAPYLADPNNCFVISSDFCHWGEGFSYTKVLPGVQKGKIYESITTLDHQGMELIEAQDAEGFSAYLKSTKNTICGRHPICVLLHAMKEVDATKEFKFLDYSQSNKCKSMSDRSVSYASGSLTVSQ